MVSSTKVAPKISAFCLYRVFLHSVSCLQQTWVLGVHEKMYALRLAWELALSLLDENGCDFEAFEWPWTKTNIPYSPSPIRNLDLPFYVPPSGLPSSRFVTIIGRPFLQNVQATPMYILWLHSNVWSFKYILIFLILIYSPVTIFICWPISYFSEDSPFPQQ
jgi:hypothetical protein